MKISCKVIEDLLPLYVDECCSEDTKQLLEKHLLQCETCKERLEKLRQPMFLSQEPGLSEKTYAKHAKRAFRKVQRRLIVPILFILILLIPLTWLGVNEVKGDGISYSNLAYVLRGNALLQALKNNNYEKAFSYLNLESLYEWETEFEETNINSRYKPVKIGEENFYVDEDLYNNEYKFYLTDDDEAVFWQSIYQKKEYMIPADKADLYLNDLEPFEKHSFLDYKVNGTDYYINGDFYNYNIQNVGNSLFKIMPEDYYNQTIKQIKEEEKVTKEIIQSLRDMGYNGYVDEYKRKWIDNFKQLKKEGISIVGYKLTLADRSDKRYQLDYHLKLDVNGKITNDYGVIFMAKNNGFYPSGGFVPDSESDNIPIVEAFHPTISVK